MEPTPIPTPADRLRARLAAAERSDVLPPARTWEPQKDGEPTLIGTLVSVASVVTRYGLADVATLRDNDGQVWSVWISGAVIAREWATADPHPGETVCLHFGGTRATADGERHYSLFSVMVDRPDLPVDAPVNRFGEDVPF